MEHLTSAVQQHQQQQQHHHSTLSPSKSPAIATNNNPHKRDNNTTTTTTTTTTTATVTVTNSHRPHQQQQEQEQARDSPQPKRSPPFHSAHIDDQHCRPTQEHQRTPPHPSTPPHTVPIMEQELNQQRMQDHHNQTYQQDELEQIHRQPHVHQRHPTTQTQLQQSNIAASNTHENHQSRTFLAEDQDPPQQGAEQVSVSPQLEDRPSQDPHQDQPLETNRSGQESRSRSFESSPINEDRTDNGVEIPVGTEQASFPPLERFNQFNSSEHLPPVTEGCHLDNHRHEQQSNVVPQPIDLPEAPDNTGSLRIDVEFEPRTPLLQEGDQEEQERQSAGSPFCVPASTNALIASTNTVPAHVDRDAQRVPESPVPPVMPTAIPTACSTGTGVGTGPGPNGLHLPTIRMIPHFEPSRSHPFPVTEREVPNDAVLKIRRYVDKPSANVPPLDLNDPLTVTFRSKVVSRTHAEIRTNGFDFFLVDTKSSSGTFVNDERISPAGVESEPVKLCDGDVLQFGVDFQGRPEDVFKCVRMRVELNQPLNQHRSNPFKAHVSKLLKTLGQATGLQSQECCICLSHLLPFQALFIAPCCHAFHFKCVRPLLETACLPNTTANAYIPLFQCPLCRVFGDLNASVSTESFGNLSFEGGSGSASHKMANGGGDGGGGGGGDDRLDSAVATSPGCNNPNPGNADTTIPAPHHPHPPPAAAAAEH